MNHRSAPPSRQRGIAVWLLLIVIFVGAAFGGAAIALWVFRSFDLRAELQHQPAMVTIDEPVRVDAKALDALNVHLAATINTSVPVNQILKTRINDDLHIIGKVDHDVPLKANVPLKQNIPVNQTLFVDTFVDSEVFGEKIRLPLRGKVPVKADIPVDMIIPIDQKVHLTADLPVIARVIDELDVPLNTVIDAAVPVDADVQVPIKDAFAADITFPPKPFPMIIEHADLNLPLSTVGLSRVDAAAPSAQPAAPAGTQ